MAAARAVRRSPQAPETRSTSDVRSTCGATVHVHGATVLRGGREGVGSIHRQKDSLYENAHIMFLGELISRL